MKSFDLFCEQEKMLKVYKIWGQSPHNPAWIDLGIEIKAVDKIAAHRQAEPHLGAYRQGRYRFQAVIDTEATKTLQAQELAKKDAYIQKQWWNKD